MKSNLLRFIFAGLMAFPTLLALADDPPASPPAAPPAAAIPPAASTASATADTDTADLRKQLDDANDKLAMALRSYSLLEAENDRLRAAADKSSAGSGSEIASLREQLRQSRAECAALAAENAAFKTHQALAGPPPGSGLAVPVRPGTPAAAAISQPPPPPVVAPPAPRTYVVVDGDTLGKISLKFYGTANRWEDIVRANKDTIHNADVLIVGTKLIIP